MALDPSIILSGQGVDVIGAMGRGNALAAQVQQGQDQNALRSLYRTQGADILAGKQPALNALAGIDPQAALGIRSSQIDMQAAQQRMDMLTREEQRAIDEYKATKTAAEAQAAAAKIEDAVKMGLAIQDPQTWDAVMSQQAPELVGQFANRQAFAMKYMSMAEALKASQGPEQPAWRAATPQEAAGYGAAGGQINGKTGEFKPINPPSGMSIQTNPDGTMSLTQGPGAGAKPMTEAQSKDTAYATRAKGALEKLDPIAGALTSAGERAANYDPTGLIRGSVQSERFQLAQQAGQEFLQAILRKDTGAAITAQEQDLYGTTYLPQPGDSPAVQAAKAEARKRAIAAIEAGMTVDQITATERALVSAAASPDQNAQPQQTRRLIWDPATEQFK